MCTKCWAFIVAHCLTEIVRAIVLGYEDFVTQKFKGFSRDAIAALTRLSDQYKSKYQKAKTELANLKNNSDLIFVDEKPRDPASDKILNNNESILTIDNKMKNIESMLEGIVIGKARGTPNEVLLKMIVLSTFDGGIEDELQRRKTRLKLEEEVFDFGDTPKDAPTLESRLSFAIGVLQATLTKLTLEKGRFSQEAANLQSKMKENQAAVGDYLFKLAELESVSVIAEQIGENLRKLNLGAEFGQKTVTRLDVPSKGSFVGPYMNRFLGIGALLGFVACCGLACLDAVVTVRRTAS